MKLTLAEIIKDSFSLKQADQKDSVALNTLDEWDSMSHMLFITRVEENYDMEFTAGDIMTMETIGDIKKILSTKGIQVV